MDAVSYPNPKVVAFFEEHLAPVRVLITSKPLPRRFKVNWTPTLVLLDADGEEHNRTVGYLPPEELIPSLMLGIAKAHFDSEQYSRALAFLDKIVAEYPESNSAPEAIYYQGVSHFKTTHDLREMKKALERLQSGYKDSEWTKRASVYQEV
jgi:thioredoxin-related protein